MSLSKVEVEIMGAGFSGLVQAFYLVEQGFKVHLYEKEKRVGGLLNSYKKEGFLNESAANAFMANQEIERICQKIGVSLIKKKAQAKKRYIYRNGKMSRFPIGFRSALKLFCFALKTKGFHSVLQNIKSQETLYSWGLRQLGEEATTYLLEPALQGVYGTKLQNLDAELVLNQLFKKMTLGDLKGSVAPLGGMGEFIDKMKSYLISCGCRISLEQCETLQPTEKPRVYALNLDDLKKLYGSLHIDLPASIKKTQITSLSSVKLLFKKRVEFSEGFGCLFPGGENIHSLGVLFNHNIFEARVPVGGGSETWILNDDKHEFSQMSEFALTRYVLSDRASVTGHYREPDQVMIDQWTGKIPVYNSALKQFCKDLNSSKKNHQYFIGNYIGALGLSKIIFIACENAKKIKETYL